MSTSPSFEVRMAWLCFAVAVTLTGLFLARRVEESVSRDNDCRQACELIGGEFAAANRYGCFCRDPELPSDGVFMLGPEVDVE